MANPMDAKGIVTGGFGNSGGGYSIPNIMTWGLLDATEAVTPDVGARMGKWLVIFWNRITRRPYAI